MSAFFDTLVSIWENSGFMGIAEDWRYLLMIVVACLLLYLAIVKEFEPLLLLPIAFGMLMANLPGSGIIHMQYLSLIHIFLPRKGLFFDKFHPLYTILC